MGNELTAHLAPRSRPLSPHAPRMSPGCRPGDGGSLSALSAADAADLVARDARLADFIRPVVGAGELMRGGARFALWLVDAPEDVLRSEALAPRLAAVRQFRLARETDRAARTADIPWLFATTKQPADRFLALVRLPSPRHDYLALACYEPDVVVTDSVLVASSPSLTAFSILSSRVFAVWHRAVSPESGSGSRVSVPITYNNFPFPDLSAGQEDALETAADHILTARESFLRNTLADLYDSARMPEPLREAHRYNDRVVLGVFGLPEASDDEAILAVLLERHRLLSVAA